MGLLSHWVVEGLQKDNTPEALCTVYLGKVLKTCIVVMVMVMVMVMLVLMEVLMVVVQVRKELDGKDVRTHLLSQLFFIASPYLFPYFSLPSPFFLILLPLSPPTCSLSPHPPSLPLLSFFLLPLPLPPSPFLSHNKPGRKAVSWTQCLCNESWDGGRELFSGSPIFYSASPLPGEWGALGSPLTSRGRSVVLPLSCSPGPPGTADSATVPEPQP